MSRKSRGRKSVWRGRTAPSVPGEWLRGLALCAFIALAAWACSALIAGQEANAYAPEIVISRVMTSNPGVCYGINGRYYDWLELKNVSAEEVNLEGWRLTDSGDLRDAFTFGNVPLRPGEKLIVYCAMAPKNYRGGAIFTGFKLSSDGETLLLSDPSQHVQSLEVPPMSKRWVFQRDAETGRYSALSFYDSVGSDAEFASTLTPPFNPRGVTINEVMAVNRSTLADADGDFSDWIELLNLSDQAVSLKDCSLSDDDADRRKWILPNVTLKPGEYRLIYCSGKDRTDPDGELHTNFRLSGKGEAVRLYNPNADAISYVRYDTANPDVSFSRLSDGTMTARLDPSPGHPNTAQGARDATVVMIENRLGLYLNEVCISGRGADWVEIRNTDSEAADLSGFGLSDDPAKPRKWQFPAGASLPAGGCALVMLEGAPEETDAEDGPAEIRVPAPEGSDADSVTVTPDYTAPFGLSQGETLCLTSAEGRSIDRMKLYDQVKNVSYGRAEGYDTWRYFTEVTPGKPNAAQSYAKAAKPIAFSVQPGIIRDQMIQLRLSTTPGVSIYYTTDGTEPSEKSSRYEGPITLNGNTCIRAVALGDDAAPSEPVVASYIFGHHSMRLVSIIGDASKLTGSKGTLKTGNKGSGVDVHVEMYEPDGTALINQDCHLNVVGHNSRTHFDQKSIRLTARRSTGDTRFRAKLFSNRDYDAVKSVVLRASGQDNMQTHMRDSILTSLAGDTSLFYQETELCVVYVNGQYYGEYNMREHVDRHAIAQFEGWTDPDGVIVSEGTPGGDAYKKLLNWVSSHDLSSNRNVETLRTMMDIENYLDYVIMEMYTCNQDLNNVARYCSPGEDARWKWVLFDLDLSYQIDRNNVKDWFSASVGTITHQSTSPFRYLMRNDDVREYFLNRFGELLATTLSAQNVVGKIEARRAALSDEMAANCKRWKWSIDTWNKYTDRMIAYAQARPAKMVKYLSDAFKLSSAEQQRYFGAALAVAGAQS